MTAFGLLRVGFPLEPAVVGVAVVAVLLLGLSRASARRLGAVR